MSDYIHEITLGGDVYISERAPAVAWLDVDPYDGSTEYADRWAVLRDGDSPHRGPCMPWPAWVTLAKAIVERHGGASDIVADATEGRIQSGYRMAIEREDDSRWRGISPRNGRFASCEGTLAEVVQLARGILAREEGRT